MILFILSWLHYTLFLLLASQVSTNYVLGTYRLTPVLAAMVSAFLWLALSERFTVKVKGEIKQFAYLIVANFFALWLVARISSYSGFGVSRFYWLFILAYGGIMVKLAWQKLLSFSNK